MGTIPQRGSVPIVAPTPTPFNEDDEPDYDLMASNVHKWCSTSLSGFVLGSYGGEEFHLSDEEKLKLVQIVVDAHDGNKFVIAGIDTPSTRVACDLSEKYAKAGADMVRIRIPKLDQGKSSSAVVDYFETISKQSPIPLIPIHQPKQPMDVDITHEQIGLISEFESVYAYIISLNYRWESRVSSFLDQKVQLWTCNGTLLLPGALMGAEGACLFYGNWAPDLCREIITLVKRGDIKKAQVIQESILQSDFIGMDQGVAALKAGLNLLGYETTVPRRPTRALGEEEIEELKRALKKADIL
jgi:dihydrodipicolinate synthase/N-acetylneuraminate lyase